jgi:uncharacterized protein YndB with AHSA1/START domain
MELNNEKDREVINTRVFNTSRDVLFHAWEDPAQLAQWWGPNGFTNTFYEFNFKAEGTWKFTMHAPGGDEFHNTSIFKEIVKPERIVFLHLLPVHEFLLTATFEELEGKTKLTFRQLFDTAEECQRIKPFITEANEQNLDRLEALVSKKLIKK